MDEPDLIDVAVAVRYRENPDSVNISKASKMTEKAALAFSRYLGPLNLDGITELTEACGISLAAYKGIGMSLEGLQKVSPEIAKRFLLMARLAKSEEKRQFLRGVCGGVCKLDVAIADLSITDPDSVDIAEATHVCDEAARLITDRRTNQRSDPKLKFKRLVLISSQSATAFLKYDINAFDEMEEITLQVARSLAASPKGVRLRSLKQLDAECAKMLAARSRALYLDLEEIDAECARALATCSGSLHLGFEEINAECARALGTCSGSIYLHHLKTIDAECARSLAKCRGTLSLKGLREMSAEIARELRGDQRELVLDGLKYVSEEVARELAGTPESRGLSTPIKISLNAVTEISDAAAQIWEDYPGTVCLNGLKKISLESARCLRKNKLIETKLDLDSMFPTSIGISEVDRFRGNPESIDLSCATWISAEAEKILPAVKAKILDDELGNEYAKSIDLLKYYDVPPPEKKRGMKIIEFLKSCGNRPPLDTDNRIEVVNFAKNYVRFSLSRQEHREYIIKHGLDRDASNFILKIYKERYYRSTHCFKCHRPLVSSMSNECSVCGWIRCSCQACGCNYGGRGL